MYDILIVDDDLFALALLEEQLKSYGDFFTPVYASNGREAVEILGQEDISLLVTDLIMPGDISGWDLIDYIENFHPHIPIVVITGCVDEEKIEQLRPRVRQILMKPIKVRQLVRIVTGILNEDITSGSLKGISVGAFLQLLEIDGRTCLLEIGNSPKNKGLLYVNGGKLYDAEYEGLRGEQAAQKIIAMDNVQFQIKALPKIEIRQQIKTDLMSIIMESMKQKDEELDSEDMAKAEEEDCCSLCGVDMEEAERHHHQSMLSESEPEPALQLPVAAISQQEQNQQTAVPDKPREDRTMNVTTLENMFTSLRCIKGYKTAALMNFSGEILISDSLDATEYDLENIGPVFNDVFRSAEEAAERIGLHACVDLVMKTTGGLVVMCCSGRSASVHFHLIALLDKDGNQALTKLQMAKLVPTILKELE